ncbi:MAG: pyruvate formate-lyase-activating protein [Porphyromonas sp.]|nr:pyruvate formate-lyase-activating protein [Porphyromonas sp.]
MLSVHSFESMGTFDGPGLRLVVFLQGCNFRCSYCANPDTITLRGGGMVSTEEILRRARSEKGFFGKRGGVTFSGGEPLLQADALIEVVGALKEEGIHTVIDTNGSVLNDSAKEVLKMTDMVLLDVKAVHPEKHRVITERHNERVKDFADYLEEQGIPMRLRCVMIPGQNDTAEDIRLIGERYAGYANLDRVEVLPYHTFGVHKYKELGLPYKLEGVEEHTREEVERLAVEFEKYFTKVWVQGR